MHAPQRRQSAKEMPCGVAAYVDPAPIACAADSQPPVLRAGERVGLDAEHARGGRRSARRARPPSRGRWPSSPAPPRRAAWDAAARRRTPASRRRPRCRARRRRGAAASGGSSRAARARAPTAARGCCARRARGRRGESRRPCSSTATDRPACAWRSAATPPPNPEPTTATSTSHTLTAPLCLSAVRAAARSPEAGCAAAPTSGVGRTTIHTRFFPTRRSGQRAGHMTEKCVPYFARCARTPARNSLRSSTSARPATYSAPGSRLP